MVSEPMKKLLDSVLVLILVAAVGYLIYQANRDGTLFGTPSPTPTATATLTVTPRPTLKPTITSTSTRTPTATVTPTATRTSTLAPSPQSEPLKGTPAATSTLAATEVARQHTVP